MNIYHSEMLLQGGRFFMSATQQQNTGWLLAVVLGAIFLGNVDVAVVNIATPSIHFSRGLMFRLIWHQAVCSLGCCSLHG